jgi:DNA-directed RNA polymerase subunit E"
MAAGQKACKKCKAIVEGAGPCKVCGSDEFSDNSKGKIIIINPTESEIAKNLNITQKGLFAVKLN